LTAKPHARLRRVVASVAALLFASIAAVAAQYPGWLIPPGGRDERSPIAPSAVADAVKRGKAVYTANCAQCHGTNGKGTGQAANYAADLTDDFRTELNTEGVLFYKVWNGHSIQLRTEVVDMPAFEGKLSKDEVWAVVEYLKVLRTPAPR
jgi:mono/diheme cytochrome c family protein